MAGQYQKRSVFSACINHCCTLSRECGLLHSCWYHYTSIDQELQLQNINKTVAVAGYAPQKQGGKTQGASSPSKFSQNVALPTEDKLSIKYNDIIPLSIFLHTRKLSLPSDASRCGDWLYLLALVWGLLTFYFKRIAVPTAAIIFLRYCGSLSEASLRLMIHPLTLPGTGG